MSKHVWEAARLGTVIKNRALSTMRFALGKGLPPALAATFTGYYCERSRHYDMGACYGPELRERFYNAMIESGHRYAEGKNSGHYASFTKRVLAELAGLTPEAPLEAIIDKLKEDHLLD